MQKSLSIAVYLFGLILGTSPFAAQAQDKIQRFTANSQAEIITVAELSPNKMVAGANDNNFVAEQSKLKKYAPFMRNLMLSANNLTGAQTGLKAARVMKGGRQVIMLGGQ